MRFSHNIVEYVITQGNNLNTADENKDPNSGDANGDGIKHFKQKNIITCKMLDPVGLAVVTANPMIPVSTLTTTAKLIHTGGFTIALLIGLLRIAGATFWLVYKKARTKKNKKF
ncbi:MAG: hypothetical protein H7196_00815 [candidate division SR1 bacterium]|nr:hypothetical protein [candidate division SR1 bacterium]